VRSGSSRQASLDLGEELPRTPGVVEAWAAARGIRPLIGVDEAGRGCLAGPVVAAAVVLPEGFDPEGLRDSKTLSARRREVLAARLFREARVGIGQVAADRIDQVNILQATFEAMRLALEALRWEGAVGLVVVDGNQPVPRLAWPQRAWPHGDALSWTVAAASIAAKVTRDAWMDQADRQWPGYGFARNKGYGTADHLAALDLLGPCPCHRRTFAPVAERIRRHPPAGR